MENLPKQSHLFKRESQYYFRISVPKHLRSHLNKTELKTSLGTKDLKVAVDKLALHLVKARNIFKMAELEIKLLATQSAPLPISPSLSKDMVIAVTTEWFQKERDKVQVELRAEGMASAETKADIIENLIDELMHLSSAENAAVSVQPFANKLFNKHGVKLKDEPAELQRFAYQQSQLVLLELANFKLGEVDASHQFNRMEALYRPISQPCKITLGSTIERFKKAKTSSHSTEKTLVGYKLLFDFAIEFFGRDKPLSDILSSDCREMQAALAKLPSNARKKFPNMPLMKTIEAASKRNAAPLSTTSVNDHMQSFSAIFNFAIGEQLTTHNPVKNVDPIKKQRGKNSGRKPFTEAELRSIFTAPLFTGCKDDGANYSRPGPNRPKRHRYWLPLIAYFTGMRLNEICQLLIDDIVNVEGFYCIKIEADADTGKKVKTEQSERLVPIPDQLLRLGFIDFVEAERRSNKSQNLFSSLSLSVRGSLSDNFSKWFANFLKSVQVKAEGRCFHSFRHNFRDRCRNARIDIELAGALGGWKHSDDVMGDYGEGHELKLKHEAMNSLRPLPADIEELIK